MANPFAGHLSGGRNYVYKKSKFGWRQNLHVVPATVRAKLYQLGDQPIVIAVAKRVPVAELQAGVYAHLKLTAENASPGMAYSLLPRAGVGKFSRLNIEGWQITRTDLPKITKSFVLDAPRWDEAGTHGLFQEREVYQTEYHLAPNIPIRLAVLARTQAWCSLRLSLDFVLDPDEETFENDLLFCLNLLQENAGAVDVFASTTSREEFMRTIRLDWRILPFGTVEDAVRSFGEGITTLGPQMQNILRDRIETFAVLGAHEYIRGTSGHDLYIGAKFAEEFIVFENLRHSNTLYVVHEEWQQLSRRSRIALLRGTDTDFDVIIVGPGWQHHLEMLLGRAMQKRKNRMV